MTIHRKYFFDSVRERLFGGSLSDTQVAGLDQILRAAELGACTDDRQLAYVLATAYHETAATMEPIEEYGKGAGHSYGEPDPETGETYYGRGFVQLTWKDNYEKMGEKLSLPLVTEPALALDLLPAARIMFSGMKDGDFTGVSLSDFISEEDTDWHNARKIINGLDRAADIAGYAENFSAAITRWGGVGAGVV